MSDHDSGTWPRRTEWTWPSWPCCGIEEHTGRPCQTPATWQKRPTAAAEWPWLYCSQHKPDGAEPIPADAPYYVTRLDVRIALTGPPGARDAARDGAIRRVQCALEAAGAVIVGLHVVGGRASLARPEAARMRLQLAGPAEPLEGARSRQGEAPGRREWAYRRRRSG